LKKKLFVTAGHEEGIFTFGEDINTAEQLLFHKFKEHELNAHKK